MRRRARRRNDGAGDEEQWLPFGIEDHEVAAFNILWDLRAVVFVGRLPDPTTSSPDQHCWPMFVTKASMKR